MPAEKKPKKPNPFNRLPINPPKEWKDRQKVPNFNYRMIPR